MFLITEKISFITAKAECEILFFIELKKERDITSIVSFNRLADEPNGPKGKFEERAP